MKTLHLNLKKKWFEMTHKELTEKCARWLKNHTENARVPNCPVIAKDLVTSAGETPDVLGFNGGCSVLIEVKISRSDFIADRKKFFREFSEMGMGQLRLYCCQPELIKIEDLPENWGLLYLNEKNKIEIIFYPEIQNANIKNERNVLLSIIRRLKKGA